MLLCEMHCHITRSEVTITTNTLQLKKNSHYFYCSVLVMLLEQKWHTSASRW